MSPKTTKQRGAISIPQSTETFPVTYGERSHSFTVNFDDAHKLRAFLDGRQSIIDELEGKSEEIGEEEGVALIESLASKAQAFIDSILGEDAYVQVFGDVRSFYGAMFLMGELAKKVGPAYDRIIAEHAK